MEEPPEEMEFGEQVRVLGIDSGVTVTEAVLETLLAVAVTVTAVLAVTVEADTVKLAEVAPEPTVTEVGVVRAELLSPKVTASPPVGAAELRVTVQVEVPPEEIDVGEQLRVLSAGRTVTVRLAVLEEPFVVAVTVTSTEVVPATEAAETVKLAEVDPAPMVTEDGVVRAELLSESATT